MLYREISLVSVCGLVGTLRIQTAGDAEGVSVQADGPYEAKVIDGSWLMIYPEGLERSPRWFHRDMVFAQTHLGSVDASVNVSFLTDSEPPMRAGASDPEGAAVQVTAPPGTEFELIGCYGMRSGPGGWHPMRGEDRFDTR